MHPPRALALVMALAGCSSLDMAMAGADSGWYDDEADGAYGGSDGYSGDDYEPEVEDDFLTLPPATTDAYVFVANPARNTVTRITVDDLSVITTGVGTNPQVVVTTDDYVRAATFNQGSDDVSIIDAGLLTVETVDVRANFNNMVLSSDGEWVVCYFDEDVESEGTSGGAQSYNEVSFVRLADGSHHPMVVGFNPREIQFTPDGSRAIVVSDSYLAIVDLREDNPSPLRVEIADDLLDPPRAEEVLLTPDGEYALVRQDGAETLVLVRLADGDVERIDVGLFPSDLDATPDGSQAVAVSKADNELWIYDLTDPRATPTVLPMPEGEQFGSVTFSAAGDQALLYSTVSGHPRYGSWSLGDDSITVYGMVKPAVGLRMTPSGSTAIVFHDRLENGDLGEEDPFYDEDAVSLIELSDHFANPIRLPDAPTGFAMTDDGNAGFLIMGRQPFVEVLDFQTLLYDEVALKSAPVHVGVLPETQTAFVSQEHELGRISFVDLVTDSVQTITGFELNSGIETN